MNIDSQRYDEIVAQLGAIAMENTKLRADLASAREAVLDDLDEELEDVGPCSLTIYNVRAVIAELRGVTPTDPELARLERELARAAVASAHARAAAKPDAWCWVPAGSIAAEQRAYTEQHNAETALHTYLRAKREGGAK